MSSDSEQAGLRIQVEGSTLLLSLSGDWLFAASRPDFKEVREFFEAAPQSVGSISRKEMGRRLAP